MGALVPHSDSSTLVFTGLENLVGRSEVSFDVASRSDGYRNRLNPVTLRVSHGHGVISYSNL